MIHAFARIVYLYHHGELLEEVKSDLVDTSTKQCTAGEKSTKIEINHLEPLIRMCGSQLHRIHTVITVELKKLKPSSPKYPALSAGLVYDQYRAE